MTCYAKKIFPDVFVGYMQGHAKSIDCQMVRLVTFAKWNIETVLSQIY